MKSLVQKMKSVWLVLLVGLLAVAPGATQAQQTEVSFQVFYDELAPHGRWFLHPRYGDVWAPNVQGEFTPYLTNGYWTVTQYGNTWVSNYDWGWATFHYGRWQFDEFEGWFWIPDTAWAPAWVVWRNGGGYYGWAPMSPGLNFSVSLNVFNNVPNFYWCFVPQQYVWRPYVYRYCAPRHHNVYIVNNTTYVTHYTINNVNYNYYTGPSHTEITHVTNRPVVIHHVEHGSSPGRSQVDRDKITMYTPIIKRNEIDRPIGGYSNNGGGKGSTGNNGNGNGSNGNNGDNDNGNTGNNGGDQGNNGHGNGDQNAPGNSGGNNNGENSENSGQGNSGNGKGNSGSRWNKMSTDRTNGNQRNGESQNLNRTETNSDVRSYRSTEIRKSSGYNSGGNRSNGSSNRTGVSSSAGGSNNSGGNNRSYTPSRTNSSGGSGRSFTPGNSGNSGGSNRSFSPTRSGSGVSKSITPSRSSGGSSRTNSPSGNGSKSKTKN
jgi:hypothetical protein